MKKLFETVLQIKVSIGLAFILGVTIYTVIALIRGEDSIPIWTLFQILLISLVGGVLQFICFSDAVIHRRSYVQRLFLFGVPFLGVLTLFAVLFHWFPSQYFTSWLIFIGIFLVMFILFTTLFEFYFRITGRKYDGLLGEYKKRREQGEQQKG